GVDFLILETFSDLEEIRQALLAVRDVTTLPVVCQMTVQENGLTVYGTAPEVCAAKLDEWGADVIGLNCSVGPHGVLTALEKMARVTGRPLSAQPNAGLPREVQGRQMYMASPEYMGKYAQRLIRAGARLVGGCCGTTPEHVRRIADAVRAASPLRSRIRVEPAETPAADARVVPLAERSNWGRKIAAGELVTSVEIVPPRGADPGRMLAGVRMLR